MITRRLTGMILALLMLGGSAQAQLFWQDDFEADSLREQWNWLREHAGGWELAQGRLTIYTERGALNGTSYNNLRNALLQDVPDEDVIEFETLLHFAPEHWYHNAGLIYRSDDDNYIRVSRGIYPDIDGVWMEWEKDGETHFRFVGDVSSDKTWLRLSRTDDTTFYATYSLNGYEWYEIARVALRLPAATSQVGLQAANGEGILAQGRSLPARFEYFGLNTTAVSRRRALPTEVDILSIFPSPLRAGQTAVTSFRIDRPSQVQWYVSDALGRRILAPVSRGRLEAGSHTISLSLRNVPAGVYFMHVMTERRRDTHRILLTR